MWIFQVWGDASASIIQNCFRYAGVMPLTRDTALACSAECESGRSADSELQLLVGNVSPGSLASDFVNHDDCSVSSSVKSFRQTVETLEDVQCFLILHSEGSVAMDAVMQAVSSLNGLVAHRVVSTRQSTMFEFFVGGCVTNPTANSSQTTINSISGGTATEKRVV